MKIKFLALLGISVLVACGLDETLRDVPGSTQSPDDTFQSESNNNDSELLDTSGPVDTIEDTGDTSEPVILPDFIQAGPYDVSSWEMAGMVTDCDSINYTVYSPQGIENPITMVLGHGFARGADTMIGWAEHFSSWGIEVLLPTLCHYNVFTGVDHEMNGQNMKELAMMHGAVKVIYAGHSAGGLAAIIGASGDPSAIGVIGLDATDTAGVPGVPDLIGQEYAGSIAVPAYSIQGEPSTCNAENNGLDLFKMMNDYKAANVTSADHCDFESPTDFICEISCENETPDFSDSEIKDAIIMLATAGVVSFTGSEDALNVWTTESISVWAPDGLVEILD